MIGLCNQQHFVLVLFYNTIDNEVIVTLITVKILNTKFVYSYMFISCMEARTWCGLIL